MRRTEKWLVPVFCGIVLVAAAVVAACGQDPARPVAFNTADSSGSDTTPHDTTPHDTVPHDTVPHDTVPHDTVPHDTVPPDTIPPDSLPQDTLPHDTLPPPVRAASITVHPESQERAVGDSGTVSAVVRDSAGREIWPAGVDWDVTDTSSVVRIRARGASYIVFDAVGPGRAVLIARFQNLADTALIFVH